MTRYLLYKNYESGLNNDLMSLELAVGLAFLTHRKLVYYGSSGDEKRLIPVRGGRFLQVPESRKSIINNQRIPTLLDILDPLPIELIDYSEFQADFQTRKLSQYHSNIRLVSAVFVPSDAVVMPNLLAEFAEGKTVLRDVEQDIFHLSECNFSYYSRFFYLPTPSLLSQLEAIRPKLVYRQFADQISGKLGYFNGIHVRLTDYRKFIPQVNCNYSDRILGHLRSIFSPEELLVICTDESDNLDFFSPILSEYKHHIFLDKFIIQEFQEAFKSLPFTDEQTLGLICNLVMANAQEFAGTLRSTYTGIIHRNWLRNRLKSNFNPDQLSFKFIDSGFREGEVAFKRGIFVETQSGLFSWNRLSWPLHTESKSWFREWPESVVSIF